jgi:hypothetical protein
LAQLDLLEEVLGRPIHVLVTVRDVRAILASLERLHRANPMTMVARPENNELAHTIRGRARIALSESGILGDAIRTLRDALFRKPRSKVIVIPYPALCGQTQKTLDQIHRALGLAPFQYDPEHVAAITKEDVAADVMEAGPMRGRVEQLDPSPWKGVLPAGLCRRLLKSYADIQELSERRDVLTVGGEANGAG